MNKGIRNRRHRPLPIVRHPTHLRLLGRQVGGQASIPRREFPTSEFLELSDFRRKFRTPSLSPIASPTNFMGAERIGGVGNAGNKIRRSAVNAGSNMAITGPSVFMRTGAVSPKSPGPAIPAGDPNNRREQRDPKPVRTRLPRIVMTGSFDPWTYAGHVAEELFGVSSAEAQPGPNNPNFAARFKTEFLKNNPDWTTSEAFFVKNRKTGEFEILVPDVKRKTKRSDGSSEIQAGEHKGGRQSNRGRILKQAQKYEAAKDGIYDRDGKLIGRIPKTTYFLHGNDDGISRQSKAFRSLILKHGHFFHALSGKPKNKNGVGNVPKKIVNTKETEKKRLPTSQPRGRVGGFGRGWSAFGKIRR